MLLFSAYKNSVIFNSGKNVVTTPIMCQAIIRINYVQGNRVEQLKLLQPLIIRIDCLFCEQITFQNRDNNDNTPSAWKAKG